MVSEHRPIDRWRASAGSERRATSIRTTSADSPYSASEREAPVNRARSLFNQARTSIVEAATPIEAIISDCDRSPNAEQATRPRGRSAPNREHSHFDRQLRDRFGLSITPNVGQASHRSGHAAPNGDRGAGAAVARTPNIEHRVRHVPHSTPNAGPGSIS
jgi:hypothetical protein